MTGNYSQFVVDGNGYTIMLTCADCAQFVHEDSPPVNLYDLVHAADNHDCEAKR
jgi:hypothetical protein